MPKEKKDKKLPAKIDENELFSSKEYASILAELKGKINECQLIAITAANKE